MADDEFVDIPLTPPAQVARPVYRPVSHPLFYTS